MTVELIMREARTPAIINHHVVTPAEYLQLLRETTGLKYSDRQSGSLSFMGKPVITIPFAEDPLFKQLQAMAVLAGASVTFPFVEDGHVMLAEFTAADGGSGWRFQPGDHTLTNKSALYPIDGPFPYGKPSTSLLSHPSYTERSAL